MKYTFCVGTYDAPELENEVALALDARSSLGFRKRGAKPSPRREKKPENPGKRKSIRAVGIAFLVLGAAALVYMLTLPERSKLLQLGGFALLGVGVFIMHAASPSSGPARGTAKSQQKAQRLLAALRQSNFAGSLRVTLDDESLRLATASSDLTVEYKELHSVIETEHLWFISYGAAGVVLQKRDLTEGESARLLADVAAASGCSTEIVYWDEEKQHENSTAPAENPTADADAEKTGEAL